MTPDIDAIRKRAEAAKKELAPAGLSLIHTVVIVADDIPALLDHIEELKGELALLESEIKRVGLGR
jgi:hypothetical protein